jgi:hypothetical protein
MRSSTDKGWGADAQLPKANAQIVVNIDKINLAMRAPFASGQLLI